MRAAAALVTLLAALVGHTAHAEQKVTVAEHEIHYVVIPTTFLKPAIASQYGLIRGEDRSLVNISVLDPGGAAVKADVTGISRNLLGQELQLEFREVVEGSAVYYLAVFRHGNEEHQQFRLTVVLPNAETATIEFQQKMYWEG